MPFWTGVLAPSQVELAEELDCKLLKFFPADPSGGLSYLETMTTPFAHLGLKFIPLGGLNAENMVAYISDANVAALRGSRLAPHNLIAEGKWKEITSLTAKAVTIIKSIRAKGNAPI